MLSPANRTGRLRSAHVLLLAAVVLTGFGLIGCQLHMHDEVKPQGPVEVSGTGVNCLVGALEVLENYPSGKATAPEVDGAWACTTKALDMFSTVAQGDDPDAFSAVALRAFLEKNFLGSIRISDSLLAEVMRIKQLLVGGDISYVTHAELLQARGILQTLRATSLKLLPYARLVLLNAEENEYKNQPEKIEPAIAQMLNTFQVIGGLLANSKQPYKLENFKTLLTEVQALYSRNPSPWQGPNWLIDHISTISDLKALLTRPDGDTLQPNEWPELFSKVGELYGIYLRMTYSLDQQPSLLSGPGLKLLSDSIEKAFVLAGEAVDAKPSKVISYAILNPVIDDVVRLKIITWKVRPSTLKSTLKVMLEKVTNLPDKQGRRTAIGGLSRENLNVFHLQMAGWISSQEDFAALKTKVQLKYPRLQPVFAKSGYPIELIKSIWPQITPQINTDLAVQNPAEAPSAHEDLQQIFSRPFPLSISDAGTVIFESDHKKLWLTQDGFNSLNWKQAFIRAVVNGYSPDPVAYRYKGLTKNQFKNFFIDVKPFGVDLGILDPGDDQVWSTAFTAANIFTLSADGNTPEGAKYLNFNEGVDFITNSLSTQKFSRKIYADLSANCRHYASDVFGFPTWEASCYRERFRSQFARYYQLFPHWVEMTTRFSDDDWTDFQHNFDLAVRKAGDSDIPVESSDIDHGNSIIHYVESLYVRFDLDHSETLNWSEASAAFPFLRDTLADASGIQNDGTLKSLFAYLLAYGRPPQSWTDKIWFKLYWDGHPGRWNFEADRHQIVRILANLNIHSKTEVVPELQGTMPDKTNSEISQSPPYP